MYLNFYNDFLTCIKVRRGILITLGTDDPRLHQLMAIWVEAADHHCTLGRESSKWGALRGPNLSCDTRNGWAILAHYVGVSGGSNGSG